MGANAPRRAHTQALGRERGEGNMSKIWLIGAVSQLPLGMAPTLI